MCIGTDENKFKIALLAEIPSLSWPLVTHVNNSDWRYNQNSQPSVPEYTEILDLVQFCFEHIGKPIEWNYHVFFQHYHIDDFDTDSARAEFQRQINSYFSRNGIAYELKPSGEVVRVLNDDLVNMLNN